MKLVLKSPDEAPFEPGKDFSVVIACEDSTTAAPACEVLELIEERITDEGRLFYQWWNFEVLTVASLRELAAAEAATADLIIIGLHEGKGLPREVSEWMKQWLGLRQNRPGALVALLDVGLKSTTASEQILTHLQAAAEFGHMEFFATRAKEGGDSEVAQWAGRTVRQFNLARKTSRPDGLPGKRRPAANRCHAKKQSDSHSLTMNSRSPEQSELNHDEVARLASQLWLAEGGQTGRDEEYWLRAERQLRANTQAGSNSSPEQGKLSSTDKNKSTKPSAVPARSSPARP